jgi:hypothetical protein
MAQGQHVWNAAVVSPDSLADVVTVKSLFADEYLLYRFCNHLSTVVRLLKVGSDAAAGL